MCIYAGITLRERMKIELFFSLDDETSRKKTSLFSRPQKILHYPLVAKIFKSDTRFELAEFVRQLNGVNGYKLCFYLQPSASTGLTGVSPCYFRGKRIEGLCSVSHIVGLCSNRLKR